MHTKRARWHTHQRRRCHFWIFKARVLSRRGVKFFWARSSVLMFLPRLVPAGLLPAMEQNLSDTYYDVTEDQTRSTIKRSKEDSAIGAEGVSYDLPSHGRQPEPTNQPIEWACQTRLLLEQMDIRLSMPIQKPAPHILLLMPKCHETCFLVLVTLPFYYSFQTGLSSLHLPVLSIDL